MKKLITLFLLLFPFSILHADVGKLAGQDITTSTKIAGVAGGKIAEQTITSGGEPNTIIGKSTIGATESSAALVDRRLYITVPSGGRTISHMWAYLRDTAGTGTYQGAIYQTNGTQVELCSSTSGTIGTNLSWVGATWAEPIFLAAGNYYIQYHTGGLTHSYAFDIQGSNSAYGTDSCGTLFGTASTREVSIFCANYDASP